MLEEVVDLQIIELDPKQVVMVVQVAVVKVEIPLEQQLLERLILVVEVAANAVLVNQIIQALQVLVVAELW
jgi:hypothetical protein